jgi:16S rRNA (guanine527-N7)-methyltransferase
MENKMDMYLQLLLKAPKRAVLMSPLEKNALMHKHIEEAKIYAPYIKNGDKVLDIGTGCGFPGIPLAIMKPDALFYLVDRKKIHTDFLYRVKKDLNLENVYIFNLEANNLAKINEEFDVVCARAVNRMNIVLTWSKPVIKENGLVLLGKKRDIEKEIEDCHNMPFGIVEIVKQPFGSLVILKKFEKV